MLEQRISGTERDVVQFLQALTDNTKAIEHLSEARKSIGDELARLQKQIAGVETDHGDELDELREQIKIATEDKGVRGLMVRTSKIEDRLGASEQRLTIVAQQLGAAIDKLAHALHREAGAQKAPASG